MHLQHIFTNFEIPSFANETTLLHTLFSFSWSKVTFDQLCVMRFSVLWLKHAEYSMRMPAAPTVLNLNFARDILVAFMNGNPASLTRYGVIK